jgi:hypothetical protein
MLVPLYEAVYERLDVGRHTRLLGLGRGSGLALLMAAARGATVTGVDSDERRPAPARKQLLPEPQQGTVRDTAQARLFRGGPQRAYGHGGRPYTMVTAFEPTADRTELGLALTEAARLAERGSAVVVAGWGPPERCVTARVLRLIEHLVDPEQALAWPSGRDDLEELARAAGLGLDGSGRVACPFAYPDLDSAVRGLFSTALFDAAIAASDQRRVEKELTEALHPYRRPDGTVRMDNVFRYLIARV